jgi:6-phosphogluconolactonase
MIADLGRDIVLVGKFEDGRCNLGQSATVPPGSGPRHLAFTPSGKFIYVLNELTSTITLFTLDPVSGGMAALTMVSSLPEDFTGENTAAEILTVNGRFLYASNRGHDSIGLFHIDPQDGQLAPVEWVSSGGTAPRHFEIDPSGRWLLAANQQSGNLSLFRIDPSSGRITPSGKSLPLSAPVCVRFIPVH